MQQLRVSLYLGVAMMVEQLFEVTSGYGDF